MQIIKKSKKSFFTIVALLVYSTLSSASGVSLENIKKIDKYALTYANFQCINSYSYKSMVSGEQADIDSFVKAVNKQSDDRKHILHNITSQVGTDNKNFVWRVFGEHSDNTFVLTQFLPKTQDEFSCHGRLSVKENK